MIKLGNQLVGMVLVGVIAGGGASLESSLEITPKKNTKRDFVVRLV